MYCYAGTCDTSFSHTNICEDVTRPACVCRPVTWSDILTNVGMREGSVTCASIAVHFQLVSQAHRYFTCTLTVYTLQALPEPHIFLLAHKQYSPRYPKTVLCVYNILLLSNSFILQFSKISRHWCYKVPTVLYNNCLFFKANMLCLC